MVLIGFLDALSLTQSIGVLGTMVLIFRRGKYRLYYRRQLRKYISLASQRRKSIGGEPRVARVQNTEVSILAYLVLPTFPEAN